MPKVIAVLAFFVLLSGNLNAQSQLTDSLERAIRTGRARDTNLVNALNRLSLAYLYEDTERAGQLAGEALNESRRLKFNRGMAVAYNLKGIVYDITSQYDSALRYYQFAMQQSRIAGYSAITIGAYNNMGMVYKNRGDYKEAIRAYYQALDVLKTNGNKKTTANVYNNLGLVYSELKQYKKAHEYHNRALKTYESVNDLYGIGASLTNIGLTYSFMKEDDSALLYYDKSLRIKEEIEDKYGMGILLNNMALIYKSRGEYRKSLAMFERSLKLAQELGNQNSRISAFINLSMLYTILKDYSTAKTMIDSARVLAENQKALFRLSKVYEAYSVMYSRKGDYKKAYEALKVYDSINDTIYSKTNSELIAEMSARFESEQKESEITLLQNQNRIKVLELEQQRVRNRNLLLAVALISLLVLAVLLLRHQRIKYRMQVSAEHEKAAIQKQAYNQMLNAEENERKRIAMELHDGLGQLLSAARLNIAALEDVYTEDENSESLKNAGLLIDQSVTDLRQISHNLMPSALIRLGLVAALNDMASKINSGRKINMEIIIHGIDQRLPEPFEIALYRVVQESVNNILKHAHATAIRIVLRKTGESLELEIMDNGKGMPEDADKSSTGIGWEDIRSRVTMFNGRMKLYSQPGEGTRLNIIFSKSDL
ncbi:MAG: sensor histidine kinase [Lentimicrobiaceae bacterium]|nr:sensor histidine kinase [Lentimicrobiaceae bacterium]